MMMKNTRIATRIAAGFGLILLMLAVLAGFTWNRMDRLQAIDAQAHPLREARSVIESLVTDHAEEYDTRTACITAVAKRLGVSYESLRRWVNQTEVDTGQRDGVPTDVARENRELKRKNRELEETIEILKAATSFFVRESDPRHR